MQKIVETTTKELAPIKARVTKMSSVVTDLVVEDAATLKEAVNILSGIKTVAKQMQDHKDARIKPLNQSLKLIRSDYVPMENYCKEAEKIVKGKMIVYDREVEAKANEEAEKIAKRVEKGTMKIETATDKMEKVEHAETKVTGKNDSKAQFRTVSKPYIVDASKLPRKYLIPNVPLINEHALHGVVIPGVEVREEREVAGYTR